MARQSDHLAEEMSRFEQEILGGSSGSASGPLYRPPQPLMSHISPQLRPPGPPPGMPPGPPGSIPPGPPGSMPPGPPGSMPPGPPGSMPPGPPPGMPPGPPRSMAPGPPQNMPPGPPHSMPRGLPGSMLPRPPRNMPSGPPGSMPPGPPPGMPPGPPGSLPPGIRPPQGQPPGPTGVTPRGGVPRPSFNSLSQPPLLDTPRPRPPPGGPPLIPPPGQQGPPPPPAGMHPGPMFRPPPSGSTQAAMGGPPPDRPPQPQAVGAVIQQPSLPLLPQPASVAGHLTNSSVVSSLPKPAPPSMIPPMVPTAVAPRPVAIAPMAVQSSLNDTVGATGVPATTKIFPAPTRPLKTKRDPKKLRMAGGQVWEDHSLDDWDQNDFRIFCGDLGNDVNDDTLARAFSKYPTFQKAKVIRDKYTKKTKGFGFVSFKDPHDFMQAMREMNGRYIGNRPVKLRKSTWRERSFDVVKKRDKEKKKLGFK